MPAQGTGRADQSCAQVIWFSVPLCLHQITGKLNKTNKFLVPSSLTLKALPPSEKSNRRKKNLPTPGPFVHYSAVHQKLISSSWSFLSVCQGAPGVPCANHTPTCYFYMPHTSLAWVELYPLNSSQQWSWGWRMVVSKQFLKNLEKKCCRIWSQFPRADWHFPIRYLPNSQSKSF